MSNRNTTRIRAYGVILDGFKLVCPLYAADHTGFLQEAKSNCFKGYTSRSQFSNVLLS